MASSSNIVTPVSPAMKRKEKRANFNNHLRKITDGGDAITAFAIAFNHVGTRNPVEVSFNTEKYNRLGSAKSLAQQTGNDAYKIIITYTDLRDVRKEWKKLVTTGTQTIIKNQRKRDPSRRTVSGFNNPREFGQEIMNFVKGAASLKQITQSMDGLDKSMSSQGVITLLMTAYAYDKTSLNHASLVYFSARNIGAIQSYLQQIQGDVNFTDSESKAINAFRSGTGPEGVSNSDVESALKKVGITRGLKVPSGNTVVNNRGISKPEMVKLINGQFIGADAYMRQTLPKTLVELERRTLIKANEDRRLGDPNWKNSARSADNLRFADLQRMTSINFVPDPSKKYKMSMEDKAQYLQVIWPPANEFKLAHLDAKDVFDKAKSTEQDIRVAWNKVIAARVQYPQLLQQMPTMDVNGQLRIKYDDILQNVRLYRLQLHALYLGVQL